MCIGNLSYLPRQSTVAVHLACCLAIGPSVRSRPVDLDRRVVKNRPLTVFVARSVEYDELAR